MKKAIVIGGSNGIGLAISQQLIKQNYYVIIVDRESPKEDLFKKDTYSYIASNLLDFDSSLFQELAKDSDVNLLMITTGIGRVCSFENLHLGEIRNLLTINLSSIIQILSIFYPRIKNKTPFYCGVMGSIAGLISSPLFSVYAASKAGLCRFIESVNIELETFGTSNRILNVSPGSLKGTRFNGGENDLTQNQDLANTIIDLMLKSKELFIPQYEQIYKSVLEKYHTDAHSYGLHSYKYKQESGRLQDEKKAIIGYLSGTFDLFHVGHLNLLKRAKEQCDYLIVGVHNSGKWKGKETFIPLEERKRIVSSCKYVDRVVDSCIEDSDAWSLYHYNRLFVGSDYKGTERFNRYEEYFKDKGVKIVYFPYTKGTSSTKLRTLIESGLSNIKSVKDNKD